MGKDKAKLTLGRRTLLAHVRRAATEAGFRARVIRRDLVPQCGPLGGVFTALRTTTADGVLFLSCDMPFVPSRLLARLVSKLTPDVEAVFTFHEKVGFPFLLRVSARGEVERLLAAKRFSIHTLATILGAAQVRLSKSEALEIVNINAPEDYATARRVWRSRE